MGSPISRTEGAPTGFGSPPSRRSRVLSAKGSGIRGSPTEWGHPRFRRSPVLRAHLARIAASPTQWAPTVGVGPRFRRGPVARAIRAGAGASPAFGAMRLLVMRVWRKGSGIRGVGALVVVRPGDRAPTGVGCVFLVFLRPRSGLLRGCGGWVRLPGGTPSFQCVLRAMRGWSSGAARRKGCTLSGCGARFCNWCQSRSWVPPSGS
jgi:hypothetical protein